MTGGVNDYGSQTWGEEDGSQRPPSEVEGWGKKSKTGRDLVSTVSI